MSDRILAVDCSNRFTCIGLVDGETPLSEMNLDLGRSQASLLPVCVSSLLSNSRLSFDDIDFVAVTVGPGYFTGIRVALSYGISLAKGLGIPAIPVSSLESLAEAARPSEGEIIVPCIRAGQEAVYCSALRREGTAFEVILAEGERAPDEFSSALSNIDGRLRVVATEGRTFTGFSLSGEPEMFSCIGGLALGETAWKNRAEAVSPDDIRARYYRSPGLGNFSK
ncbi:MAG: tRNA (adenosine(37)-N6)-threonylcarbamoyltransferase complex dimerization subunit type 1 TsaB [Synergistales bacterium]|nr:tRNA (adenosine(37)-N6)-threonylcarbamoyltransferase complex dimerization subunit type 1 TsaB [Synergistales bacterium]